MALKDHAALLWDRAEECRATANAASDLQIKARYMQLANGYLKLAAQEEALRAHNGPNAASPRTAFLLE